MSIVKRVFSNLVMFGLDAPAKQTISRRGQLTTLCWRRFAALSNFRKVNTGWWPDLEWSFFSGAIWSNFFGFLWSAKTGGVWSTVPALAPHSSNYSVTGPVQHETLSEALRARRSLICCNLQLFACT